MRIIGFGIDICENNRFLEKVNQEKFVQRILSMEEYALFESFQNDKRKLEFLCGRFCAKEALFKALSVTDFHVNYKDISILNDENGKPYILFEKVNGKMHVSISHETNYTVASVIIEEVSYE